MVSKRGLYIVLMVAVFFGALLVNAFFLHNKIQSVTYYLLRKPLTYAEGIFQSRDREIADLKQERDELLSRVAREEILQRENVALRRQLDLGSKKSRVEASGHIFALQRNVVRSAGLVDLGSADGIVQGMTVISAGNILVGKIIDVYDHTSRVMLADDPESIISVRMGSGQLLAESRGALKNHISLNLISRTDVIEAGAVLTTSGLDKFPEGLLVGKVISVKPAPQSLFQDVRGDLLFDPSLSNIVFITL